MLMKVRQAAGRLRRHVTLLQHVKVNRLILGPLPEELAQIPSFAQLHRQHYRLDLILNAKQLHEIVILQRGMDARLQENLNQPALLETLAVAIVVFDYTRARR